MKWPVILPLFFAIPIIMGSAVLGDEEDGMYYFFDILTTFTHFSKGGFFQKVLFVFKSPNLQKKILQITILSLKFE